MPRRPEPGQSGAARAEDRISALLRAHRAIAGEVAMPRALARIVDAARELTGARFAAIGVVGTDRRPAEFVHAGVSAHALALIGSEPDAGGLPGLLFADPAPLSLEDLTAPGPAAGGAGAPPMHAFLGVPIRIRGVVSGNLYLTEKVAADGMLVPGGFDAIDEQLATCLAASAAVAIDNARLYDESRGREALQRAVTEVTRVLLDGADPDDVLRLIAERAGTLAGADTTIVLLPGATAGELRVRIAVGFFTGRLEEQRVPVLGSLAGKAASTGRPLLSDDLRRDPRAHHQAPAWQPRPGPGMAVPFPDGERDGAMVLTRARDRGPFTAADLDLVAGFVAQAALVRLLACRAVPGPGPGAAEVPAAPGPGASAPAAVEERGAGGPDEDIVDAVAGNLADVGARLRDLGAFGDPVVRGRLLDLAGQVEEDAALLRDGRRGAAGPPRDGTPQLPQQPGGRKP